MLQSAHGSHDILQSVHGSHDILQSAHGSHDILQSAHGSHDILQSVHGSHDILQSAHGSHDILHSLKEFATDNSCSVVPGTMFCESKELIQAKTGSQIGKQVLICSSHISEKLVQLLFVN